MQTEPEPEEDENSSYIFTCDVINWTGSYSQTDIASYASTVMTLMSDSATVRTNSSQQAWQKHPPSRWSVPPGVVS